MVVYSQEMQKVLEYIDKNELLDLAVKMGNIQAPSGFEENMTHFVADWLREQGITPTLQAVTDDRRNVVAILKGSGNGYHLLFNSHLDSDQGMPDQHLSSLDEFPPSPKAWVEGDKIFGKTVQNDRGPMAATMVAAKAIRRSKIELKGDVILSMVVGEIGMAQIEEFQGSRYLGKGIGSRHLVTHGPTADYALVAETTDFGVTWIEAGVLYLRITLFGKSLYTPRSYRSDRIEKHPNAIVKMAFLIQLLEDWGKEYETKYTQEYPTGILIPKVSIGAIRGGGPYKPSRTSDKCSIYMDIRLPPFLEPAQVVQELREVIGMSKIEADVEPYLFHRGYVGERVEPLVEAVRSAHRHISGVDLPPVSSPEISMWRDVNVFNQAGIPSATFGPRRISLPGSDEKYIDTADLFNVSKMYALLALDICSKTRNKLHASRGESS